MSVVTVSQLTQTLTPSYHALCRWERSSFGYHGDDGKKYHDSGRGEAYGPPFSTGPSTTPLSRRPGCSWSDSLNSLCNCFTPGDVAGAGIILSRGEVFFTYVHNSLIPSAFAYDPWVRSHSCTLFYPPRAARMG